MKAIKGEDYAGFIADGDDDLLKLAVGKGKGCGSIANESVRLVKTVCQHWEPDVAARRKSEPEHLLQLLQDFCAGACVQVVQTSHTPALGETAKMVQGRFAHVTPANWHGTRNGAAKPPLVNGATMTVWRRSFISSGETMTAGRVFRISEPSAGSSRVSQTSNLFISAAIRPGELGCVPFVGGVSKGFQFFEVTIQLGLRDGLNCLGPALAGILRSRADNQRTVLNRDGGVSAETTCFHQLLRQEQPEPIANLFQSSSARRKYTQNMVYTQGSIPAQYSPTADLFQTLSKEF